MCVHPDECYGTALTRSGSFLDYVPTGSWDECSAYAGGVCCVNPIGPDLKPAGQCGIRNVQFDKRIDPKIATKPYDPSREASFGEFPWQAIIFQQNYTFVCGASLITNKHLITGAHCVYKYLAPDIKIRLGEWQVNTFDEALGYVDFDVHSIQIHPDFNQKNLHNDVAIIELVKPVEFNYHINTICMPDPTRHFTPGYHCIATGWGKDSFEGKNNIKYIQNVFCFKLFLNIKYLI